MKKGYKLCPFCGEEIKEIAKKCRFCGEFLEADFDNKSINTPEEALEETLEKKFQDEKNMDIKKEIKEKPMKNGVSVGKKEVYEYRKERGRIIVSAGFGLFLVLVPIRDCILEYKTWGNFEHANDASIRGISIFIGIIILIYARGLLRTRLYFSEKNIHYHKGTIFGPLDIIIDYKDVVEYNLGFFRPRHHSIYFKLKNGKKYYIDYLYKKDRSEITQIMLQKYNENRLGTGCSLPSE